MLAHAPSGALLPQAAPTASVLTSTESVCVYIQRWQDRLSSARAQRNRLLAAFEGIQAAEDDMEAVIARSAFLAFLLGNQR